MELNLLHRPTLSDLFRACNNNFLEAFHSKDLESLFVLFLKIKVLTSGQAILHFSASLPEK